MTDQLPLNLTAKSRASSTTLPMPSPRGPAMAARLYEHLKAPPRRDAGAWAEANRRLPRGSPLPGRFRNASAPYLADIFKAFADPDVKTVVWVCAAQMGKTELILDVIGWRMDDRPAPCLYVAPTQKLAVSVMKDRVNQLIRSTPSLAAKLDTRRGFDTTMEKWRTK